MNRAGDERLHAVVVATAVVGSAAVSLWRLQGLLRLAALALVAMSALGWLILLSPEVRC